MAGARLGSGNRTDISGPVSDVPLPIFRGSDRRLRQSARAFRAERVVLRPWLRIGNDRYLDPWFYSKVDLVILVQVYVV